MCPQEEDTWRGTQKNKSTVLIAPRDEGHGMTHRVTGAYQVLVQVAEDWKESKTLG